MTEGKMIPILDLNCQIESLWDELNQSFQRVLRSGHFILGEEEQHFEEECAAYLGVKHAIGLNSGTDALYIAMRALGIGPGDEVITTPFTFFATAEAISFVGATPVFVDVEEKSLNLDPTLLEAAITQRTKAVIPVHLFGRPCNMDAITAVCNKYNLKIIEDCAQSFGATWKGRKVGSIGSMGCFSFFPTKNLNAFGDGGLVTTDDSDLARLARMLRVHGSQKKYYNEMVGFNSRLDELQAAMLRVKLPHIDEWNRGRSQAADSYLEQLGEANALGLPEQVEGHVYHQYTVRIKDGRRDAVQARLLELGVGSMVYYPVPVHRLKLYENSHASVKCPVAEEAAKQVLSLPIWPEIVQGDTLGRVCQGLLAALAVD